MTTDQNTEQLDTKQARIGVRWHRALKIAAADQGRSIKGLLEEILTAALEQGAEKPEEREGSA